MRVVLLNQYYAPDHAATAQLASDLGAELARMGHEVIAIASDRPYAGPGTRRPPRERIDGVEIHRVPATARGRRGRLDRVVDYLSFYARAALVLRRLPRPDVIVALTTPPFIAALGVIERQRRGSRLVVWTMDVYPDVALALGALAPGGWLARALGRVHAAVLGRADAVVALDEAMRERLVAAGAPSERVAVIDNWWDGREVSPRPAAGSAFRRALGCGDRTVLAYFGNLGMGHDFATLLAAIERLAREDRWAFVFVGHGPRRAEVERALARSGAWHRFLPPLPRAELGDALAAAEVLYVSLGEALEGLVVPSKLYAALAAGRPIAYVGPARGRVGELVEDAGLGIGVRNGAVEALVQGLERLRTDPAERASAGERARALFEARYDRSLALARHRALLEELAGRC